MTRIVLWLKEPVLDEESNKKVIAYKITGENKLTKKNIIKFYQIVLQQLFIFQNRVSLKNKNNHITYN